MPQVRPRAFGLSLLLLLLGCASAPGPDDANGHRFLCGPQEARQLCLPVVRGGCAVHFLQGESIPPEAGEKVVRFGEAGEEVRVQGPSGLTGCVRIETAADALEYLRFFSSLSTVHLFEPQRLEVFPGRSGPDCRFTCLAPRIWRRLGLTEAAVTVLKEGSFEVRRTVMKPEPQLWRPTLYRVVERVTRDGAVRTVSEEPVPARLEDLKDLSFPMYL